VFIASWLVIIGLMGSGNFRGFVVGLVLLLLVIVAALIIKFTGVARTVKALVSTARKGKPSRENSKDDAQGEQQ
jgi:formate hydrogenlyase subunit 3/multisubunit Na+/H+ antiporter MnhD subunit